ncbi:hypothetical protein [Chryseobacterium sp. T20]|uniref:hypothetical protein n=1 Tax=Chryseobacterium sp. T20 TaxID=3395375 RepID=UPI0039BD21DE
MYTYTHAQISAHLVIPQESRLLDCHHLSSECFLALDSYGMTNSVDRLSEQFVLCPEQIRDYTRTSKRALCHSAGI